MGGSEPTFFEGFSWPVPTGFRSALAGCHFNVGDILYDSKGAYNKSWKAKSSKLRHLVQVQETYSADVASADNSDRAFQAAWVDGVAITLHDHNTGTTESLDTTQGRIYSLLWKGDLELLDLGRPEPPPPRMAGELRKELAAAAEVIVERGAIALDKGHGFLFAVDHASSAQELKARTVRSALRTLGDVVDQTSTPGDLGIAGEFCPTIVLHCCAVRTTERGPIEAALKARLYKPAKDRKTDVDRFNLEKHGWLFALRE